MPKRRGAPKGNRNRMTHGIYSRQFQMQCKEEDSFIADCMQILEKIESWDREIDEMSIKMPGATREEVIAAINASKPKVSIGDF